VSPDLFTHSVSYFAEAPLSHHSSAALHVHVYSCVANPDAKTLRLQGKVCVGWRAAQGAWCGPRGAGRVSRVGWLLSGRAARVRCGPCVPRSACATAAMLRVALRSGAHAQRPAGRVGAVRRWPRRAACGAT
jgi:hypothetical protein